MTHDEALKSPLGRYLLKFCYCGYGSTVVDGKADTCRIHYALAGIDSVLPEAEIKIREMTDALNKIHDLAGQVAGSDFINTHMGAIQDWCHKVTGPCSEKQEPPSVGSPSMRCPKCGSLLSSPSVRRCVNGHDF